jgi:VWFA-related protein
MLGLLFAGSLELAQPAGQALAPAQAASSVDKSMVDNSAPEMNTHEAPATFSTKVNLVLVPVVVRDGKGHTVGTLEKDDFQLFDKGKPQLITKFSLEKAGAPSIPVEVATDESAPEGRPPSAPPIIAEHFVAYLFDDVHLDASDLLRARNATGRHVDESLEPTTRAAVFTTSGQVTQDFTSDRDKLRAALDRIKPRAGSASVGATCPDMDYYLADLIENKHDSGALTAATAAAMACIPPPPANTPQAMRQAQLQAQQTAESAAMQMINLGERETRLPLIVLKDVIRRMGAAPGSRTVVLLSPGFFVTTELRQDETEIIDRAIRANVTVSSLDARGLYTLIPGGDAGQSVPTPTLMLGYKQDSALASADILAELAEGTGGTFFHNNNDLKEGFRRVAEQPEYRYVLGFAPQNLKFDGAFHTLKVTLKNSKGLDLQTRRGYYAPKHLANPEDEIKQQLQEALYSREEIQDIPLDLHLQFFKFSDVNARLAVLARVDVKNLRFRKAAGRNNDNLTVLSGLFDRDGNYISGITKLVEMRLRDQTLEKLLTSGITVRTNFDVTPGRYVIRLVVRDAEGQTIAARNGAVQIP